jgi:hypothetical protein
VKDPKARTPGWQHLSAGNYSTTGFHIQSGGQFDGDMVTCFMPGTMIRTPRGEQAVETFKPGDLVVIAGGGVAPVRWIGCRRIMRIFADPLRVLPIRIKAGALGEHMPARDPLLSPDHALLIDDLLIQASALINGISILRETAVAMTFTYYHVELDHHSLIVAENTPAETFVDNVDRMATFDNWHDHQALYPNGKPIVEMPFARAKASRQVPRAIIRRLAERGAALYGPPESKAA